MIRAVIFDCDGVLVDSEPLADRAWAAVMLKYGYRVTAADTGALLGRTEPASHAYFADRVELPPYEVVIGEVDEVRWELFADLEAFPDAVATVQALAMEGIPLAVGSSSRRVPLERKLDRFDLVRYFHVIVSGDDVEHGKPAPDIFLAAAAGLGADASECLVVEDAPLGAAAATAAGMRVVVVRRNGRPVAGYSSVSSLDVDLVRTWMGLG